MRNNKGQFIKGYGFWTGKKRSQETIKKVSESLKGKTPWNKGKKGVMKAWNKGVKTGCIPWNKGIKIDKVKYPNIGHNKPHTEESKLKNRLNHIGKNSGKDCYLWKGGITPINKQIRTSDEYKQWRMQVLKRDYWTCQKCGYKSKKARDIVVDHIYPFVYFPELRFDVANGRTLCKECDAELGFNYYKNNDLELIIEKSVE